MKTRCRLWLIFVIVFLLTITPLPAWMCYVWPSWTLLALMYGLIFLPGHVGVVFAFIVGLILDILVGPVLGLHALIYTCLAFLVLKTHWFVKALLPLQQAILISIVETIILMSEHRLGVSGWSGFLILTTGLCWLGGLPVLQYLQPHEELDVR